jgi:hypothetical protein
LTYKKLKILFLNSGYKKIFFYYPEGGNSLSGI